MQAIVQPQFLLIAHRFLYRWTARMFESEPFLPEHLVIVERLAKSRTTDAAAALEPTSMFRVTVHSHASK
jgi:hypothetical protein